MNLAYLRNFTPARVALGRAGDSLPTSEMLEFQLAHARARDAVHASLDAQLLALELKQSGRESLILHSAASDRFMYLRRPDLGRRLSPESRATLPPPHSQYDAAFIIADGLSALAVQRHALPLLACLDLPDWNLAPIAIAEQARVAIGDEVGFLLGASLAVVLIGERPGLSAPDSLGIYVTWQPEPGRTDADRNCISNVRTDGLSYPAAAHKLMFLMREARRRKLSGVRLKEDAQPTTLLENLT